MSIREREREREIFGRRMGEGVIEMSFWYNYRVYIGKDTISFVNIWWP